MATGNVAQIIVKAKTGAAQKSLSRLNKTMGSMKQAAKGLAIASVAGGAALGAVGAKAFSMAASLEAVQQKTQIVFGDQLPLVQQWADSTANAMGLTSLEAQGLAANFGDLLIPMGFSRDLAAEMATETIGLSGALAEWSGGTKTAAEVSDILAKAMLGEREQLKTLGISITEADVKTRLMSMGMDELTGKQLQQAKAMATQQLIFEKSADAQAKYAEGSGSLMRTQAELTASLKTVKDEVLIALMPTFQSLADFMASTVVPAIQEFIPVLREKIPQAIEMAGVAFEAAKPFLELFWKGLMTIKDGVMALVNIWKNQGPQMKVAIAAVGLAIAVAFGPVSVGFLAITGLITLIGLMRDKWREIANSIIGIVETMAQGIANVAHTIVTTIHENIINAVINLVNMFIDKVGPILKAVTGGKVTLERLNKVEIPQLQIKIPRLQRAADKVVESFSNIEPVIDNFDDSMASAKSSIKSMWETQMEGAAKATEKEEELARKRGAQIDARQRMNIQLLTAMYKSWAAGPQTQAFRPNMQFGENLQLQSFATGGIVRGPRGQAVPIIAHGGEQVIPANRTGGVTVNINGLVAGDPILIGRQIADIINKSARANRGLIKSEAVAS